MSPAEAILQTVAGSSLASPARRAVAQLALMLGAFDPTLSVLDLIVASRAPSQPCDFLSDLVREMRNQQNNQQEKEKKQ